MANSKKVWAHRMNRATKPDQANVCAKFWAQNVNQNRRNFLRDIDQHVLPGLVSTFTSRLPGKIHHLLGKSMNFRLGHFQ